MKNRWRTVRKGRFRLLTFQVGLKILLYYVPPPLLVLTRKTTELSNTQSKAFSTTIQIWRPQPSKRPINPQDPRPRQTSPLTIGTNLCQSTHSSNFKVLQAQLCQCNNLCLNSNIRYRKSTWINHHSTQHHIKIWPLHWHKGSRFIIRHFKWHKISSKYHQFRQYLQIMLKN